MNQKIICPLSILKNLVNQILITALLNKKKMSEHAWLINLNK